MPVLRNARHEAFAQALAKGKSASDAYVAAGYAESRSAASRLSTNVNIRRRVDQIVGRVAEKAEWSAADRLRGLKSIYDATEGKDPRTAIAAIAEANKMQGSHAPAKHQHAGPNGGPIQTVDLTNMSPDDLDRLEALFGPLAGSSGDDAEDDPAGEGAARG
jgi:phage terminase small subunit